MRARALALGSGWMPGWGGEVGKIRNKDCKQERSEFLKV